MRIEIDKKTANSIKKVQNNQQTIYNGIEISIVSYGWGPIYGISLSNTEKESIVINSYGIKFIIGTTLSHLIIGFKIEKKGTIYEVIPIQENSLT